MRILQVNSSARRPAASGGSVSTALADELVASLRAADPTATVTVRDLAITPHPALDEATLQALFTPPAQRNPAQVARVAADDALIAEIQSADTIVIAAPMYNFGVSSQLKNWIDAIARAGVTFRYTERGPEGLLQGKKVFVVTTRGGIHRGTTADTIEPYLRHTLGFLGMTELHFVFAEGLAMGTESEARGLADARAQIDALRRGEAVSAA